MMNGERHYRYRTAINRYSPLGGGATDRKKAKKRHLTEGMTEETLTDLTVLDTRDSLSSVSSYPSLAW